MEITWKKHFKKNYLSISSGWQSSLYYFSKLSNTTEKKIFLVKNAVSVLGKMSCVSVLSTAAESLVLLTAVVSAEEEGSGGFFFLWFHIRASVPCLSKDTMFKGRTFYCMCVWPVQGTNVQCTNVR